MKSLIIIPTYKEKENIERLVRTLFDLGQEIELVVVLVEFYGFPVLEPHHDAIQKLPAPSRRRDLGSAGACKRAGVCSLEPYL